MKLTDEQIAAVAQWFAAGASLDEIQKRIAADFGVHMTYLDLRLLVADLPQPKEEEADVGATGVPPGDGGGQGAARPTEADADGGADAGATGVPPVDDGGQGAARPTDVSVSVDPVTPAGMMAGGDVTFSDGTTGKWYLDQMGRLGLSGIPQGYRPSPEDAALFQSRLVEALQAKGMM